ncbi:MAG: restriction endonuclease subunit R, partial [Nocardioidaceae bacterium]
MAGSEGSLVESLGERLFKARLELITKLDAGQQDEGLTDASGITSETGLRVDTIHLLHDQVEGMNPDNVVVRPQRRWIEIYLDLDNWHRVTSDEAIGIAEHLAELPTSVRDDDEQAKRFDLLMLRLQLGALDADPGFDRLRAQVQAIAAALLEQTNIPAVREQQELLDEVAGDDWWVDVTLPMLELLRRRVRSLVRLI